MEVQLLLYQNFNPTGASMLKLACIERGNVAFENEQYLVMKDDQPVWLSLPDANVFMISVPHIVYVTMPHLSSQERSSRY